MSTKTNFKRIALVAVAALGLGVLTSVAPANAVDNGYLYVYGNGGDSESSRGVVAGDYEESISDKFGKVTMLSTGSLYVKADSLDSEDYNNIIVSGATITSCSGYDLNSTQTVCLDSNENDITATVKPNSGVTSFTINQ